jgi:hypothetical protein
MRRIVRQWKPLIVHGANCKRVPRRPTQPPNVRTFDALSATRFARAQLVPVARIRVGVTPSPATLPHERVPAGAAPGAASMATRAVAAIDAESRNWRRPITLPIAVVSTATRDWKRRAIVRERALATGQAVAEGRFCDGRVCVCPFPRNPEQAGELACARDDRDRVPAPRAQTRWTMPAIGPGWGTVDQHASTSACRALAEPCLELWACAAGAAPDWRTRASRSS